MSVTEVLSLIGFPSLFVAAISYMHTKLLHNTRMTQAVQLGVQALLRDRLYQLYGFCYSKGSATIEERENFENMYQQYHSLGANGVMDDIHKKFLDLSIKEDYPDAKD